VCSRYYGFLLPVFLTDAVTLDSYTFYTSQHQSQQQDLDKLIWSGFKRVRTPPANKPLKVVKQVNPVLEVEHEDLDC
jgi:hypothetical protein